jgi:hypothetical protein
MMAPVFQQIEQLQVASESSAIVAFHRTFPQ